MELINNGIYNFQGDLVSVKGIGHNLTSNKIGLYSITIPVHDALSGMPLDRMLGRDKVQNQIFTSDGELAGITLSNVNLPTAEGTLTIADNALFETDKSIVAGYRNALESLLLGETFSDGTDLIRVLGVGGNVKLTNGMLRGKDWKYFFEKDNKLIKAYTGSEATNVFLGAYNRTSLCNCLEVKGIANDDTTKVIKYAGVFFSGNNLGEADERNNVTVNAKFNCDFRTYNQTMEEGFATDNVDADTATTIYKIEVNYIIAQSGGAAPTDFGTNGETACIIDTDDGTFTIKKTNGTDAWTAINGGIGQGCLIFSKKLSTGATIAAATDAYNYVAVKTAGAAGTGTAVATTVTSPTTYTLGTTYTLPVYVFQMSTGTFAAVTDGSEL